MTFKRIHLKNPVLEQVSSLYSLKPIGVGTPYVESLTGYISRLAAAHAVSTTALFGYVIAPLLEKPYVLDVGSKYYSGILGGHFRGLIKTINGIGGTAEAHVNALECLTLRRNLVHLTLLPWGDVISEQHLSRSNRVWCPECFEELKGVGQTVYEQLLWTLKTVNICLIHRRPLESQCHHCNAPQLPLLASGTRPGYCSYCKQWLGVAKVIVTRNGSVEVSAESDRQLFAAKSCGELLASVPSPPSFPRRIKIATAVYQCISHFAIGNVNELARQVWMPGKTLSNWRAGRTVPQLDLLLKFCCRLSLSLTDVLTKESFLAGRKSCAVTNPERFSSGFKTFIAFDVGEVRTALKNALDERPVPSLGVLSIRLNINSKKLRGYFPDLCQALVEKRVMHKEEHWVRVKEAMEAALTEIPPPSVKTLATRLGLSKSILYQRLSPICQMVAARHAEYCKECLVKAREEVEREVHQVAMELNSAGIYPSERAVSKRLSNPGRTIGAIVRRALRSVRKRAEGSTKST